MRLTWLGLLIMVACAVAACQTTPVLPAAQPIVVTDRPALNVLPTFTPRPVTLPTSDVQPVIAPLSSPVFTNITPTFTPLQPPIIVVTATPDLQASPTEIVIGLSVQGRAITARRFGSGETVILLVGGMHGGWEANTVQLIDELIAYFDQHPADVQSAVSIVLIRAANPDGLPLGRTPEGRFNANGVDLNRNWGCNWSREAVWRNIPVNPGANALSEPETQALSTYMMQLRPRVALFYHSAAGGVYAGNCQGGGGSALMAAALGEATGYSYGQAFSAYPVTGTAAAWADNIGIAAADVELFTSEESEFDRNLRGIIAVQAWVTQR